MKKPNYLGGSDTKVVPQQKIEKQAKKAVSAWVKSTIGERVGLDPSTVQYMQSQPLLNNPVTIQTANLARALIEIPEAAAYSPMILAGALGGGPATRDTKMLIDTALLLGGATPGLQPRVSSAPRQVKTQAPESPPAVAADVPKVSPTREQLRQNLERHNQQPPIEKPLAPPHPLDATRPQGTARGGTIKWRGPADIITFIRSEGGVIDDGGDLASSGVMNKPRVELPYAGAREQFVGPVISPRGRTLDDIAIRLKEEGFVDEVLDHTQLKELIADAYNGNRQVFRASDENMVIERAAIEAAADEYGLDVGGKSVNQILDDLAEYESKITPPESQPPVNIGDVYYPKQPGETVLNQKQESLVVNDLPAAKGERVSGVNPYYLESIYSPEDMERVIRLQADELEQAAKNNPQTWDQVRQQADELSVTFKDIEARRRTPWGSASEALAYRRALATSVEQAKVLASKVLSPESSPRDLLDFQSAYARMLLITDRVSGASSETGRVLNALKIKAKSDTVRKSDAAVAGGLSERQAIEQAIKDTYGQDRLESVAKMLLETDDLGKAANMGQKMSRPDWGDYANEWIINSMLSGPKTQSINVTSNASVQALLTAEDALAMGIGKIRKAAARSFLPGKKPGDNYESSLSKWLNADSLEPQAYAMTNLVEGAKDALLAGARAWKTKSSAFGNNVLDTDLGVQGAIPGKFGEVVRTPSRLLQTADDFFKAIRYRAEVTHLATIEGRKSGLRTIEELQDYVDNIRRDVPERIAEKARERARYSTFTDDLRPFGQSMLAGLNKANPLAKTIIRSGVAPFIRTPVNILKFAGERTPLAAFSKYTLRALKSGGVEGDRASARLLLGSTISALIYKMAEDGLITPSESGDASLRGIQRSVAPSSSLKVKDGWLGLDRFEPLSTLLLFSDLHQLKPLLSDEEYAKAASLAFASVTKNVLDKAFTQGVADVVQAAYDPDRYIEDWVVNRAASPVPNIFKQSIRELNIDVVRDDKFDNEYSVEARSFLNKIKARVLGANAGFPPKIDDLGQPIKREKSWPMPFSPFTMRKLSGNPVATELYILGVGPPQIPTSQGGVDMTEKEISNYKYELGGYRNDLLSGFFNSEAYRKAGDGYALYKKVATEYVMGKRTKEDFQEYFKDADSVQAGLREKAEEYRDRWRVLTGSLNMGLKDYPYYGGDANLYDYQQRVKEYRDKQTRRDADKSATRRKRLRGDE